MKLTLTGDRIDADEALRIGLVDEVVPHERLEARTFEIADKIASHSALAVRLAKAAVRASARLPLDQGLRYEQTLFARSEEHTSELQSPDHLVCRLLLEKKKQTIPRLK